MFYWEIYKFFKRAKCRCSVKKLFIKISQYSHDSTCVGVSLQGLQRYEQTPTHMFSCEYCKIFKKTYFEEQLRTTASYSFSTEHFWATASVSLNLGNSLTDYKQYQILF